MRMGLRNGKMRPHNAAGYTLIFVGALVMLMAMPMTVYLAAIGALIAFVGYTVRGR